MKILLPLAGLLALALSSCTVSVGADGRPVFGADPAAIQVVVDRINQDLADQSSGK